jgi:hypothetical protein
MVKNKITYGLIYASLFIPAAWVFLKLWEADGFLSLIWIPVIACAFGIFWFNDRFIAKEDIPRSEESLGPQDDLPSPQWGRARNEQGQMQPKKTFNINAPRNRTPPEF